MRKRVLTVGGGTGSPVVNLALLLTGKVDFINAIATTFDNGGESQRRRLDSFGKEIAYSDAIRILVSLIDPSHLNDPNVLAIKRWLLHRDVRDKVLGREIVNTFFDFKNGFSQIEEDIASFGIPLMGRVLPASTYSAQLVFTTISKMKYKGENLLDENRMSPDMVSNMELEPLVDAYGPTLQAIRDASVIFLSCGTMHGSLLCNFLAKGMKKAMKETKAKVYLITNLFSVRNETHDVDPISLAKLVKKYSGKTIDGLIVPELSRKEFEMKYPKAAKLYKDREYSYFLGWKEDVLEKARKTGLKIIRHNAVNVIDVPKENLVVVRHDPVKLAEAIKILL